VLENLLKEKEKYSLINVWQEISNELNNEIVEFWRRNDALPPGEDPEERADQVVFIVRNEREEIVALCTAVKTFVSRFKNDFYLYRTMTDATYREQGVAMDLLIRTRDFFEKRFKEEKIKTCIGILFNLENERLGAVFREAIRPRTKFIFMGYNNRDQQIRAYYFDGAEI